MTDNAIEIVELPEKPIGYTKQMVLHINQRKGHIAFFDVFDPSGKKCDFGYCYIKSGKESGFTIDDADKFIQSGNTKLLTWNQLREVYPQWLAQRNQAIGA